MNNSKFVKNIESVMIYHTPILIKDGQEPKPCLMKDSNYISTIVVMFSVNGHAKKSYLTKKEDFIDKEL